MVFQHFHKTDPLFATASDPASSLIASVHG